MRRRSLLLLLVVGLLGLPRPAWAAPADERAAHVARLEGQRGKLDEERRALEQRLGAKTQEVVALKKQRASWSRDQKLGVRLREAQDLAAALDRKAEQIRGVDAQLRSERGALVNAANAELAGTPGAARAQQLTRWRNDAQRQLGGPRRVEVADEDMSPLDDPEDLDEKAGTLADSEQRLRGEEARLERRASYYHKQAKLQRAKQREKEQDLFDDEPRRGGSSGGANRHGGGDILANDPSSGAVSPPVAQPGTGTQTPPPPPGNTPPPPATGGLTEGEAAEDASSVYADVVDPGTLVELERAERSGDPDNKATAAERALRDVRARADRLRAKRLEMEKRARLLREQGN